MMSATEENYLKTLLYLEGKQGEATANELSKALDIRMSTVSSMMKKLADKGLVHYETYKPIHLTDEGRTLAALILRKHRLTEMFLVEIMGMGWEEVHTIAEQIEHIQSPTFFDRMDELMGHPKVDPHGSPIPDKDGVIPEISHEKLSGCHARERVLLQAIEESSVDLLQYLSRRGLELGMFLEIIEVEPFDGSMIVEYNNQRETLSKVVCDKLLVKPHCQ